MTSSAWIANPPILVQCAETWLRPWSRLIVDDLRPDFYELGEKARRPECTSLAWSADGQILFAGFSDNLVRVWVVVA